MNYLKISEVGGKFEDREKFMILKLLMPSMFDIFSGKPTITEF